MIKFSMELNTLLGASSCLCFKWRIHPSGIASLGSVGMAGFNFLEGERGFDLSLLSMMLLCYQRWPCVLHERALLVCVSLIPPEPSVILKWFCMLWPLSWCLWQHLSKAHQHAGTDPAQGSPRSGLALTLTLQTCYLSQRTLEPPTRGSSCQPKSTQSKHKPYLQARRVTLSQRWNIKPVIF